MSKTKSKSYLAINTNSKSVPEEIKSALADASPEIRKRFFLDVIKHTISLRSTIYNQDKINWCISNIESGNQSKYPFFKYSVVYEDDKKILTLKRKDKIHDPIIQIVSQDELQNVISDAFLIDPQIDYNDLMTILSTRYLLPPIQYKHYFLVFNSQVFKSTMQCGLLTIGEKSDSNFNFVLICVDSASNYTYMRPLMTRNHNEIAIELLKILLDVGIPIQIEVFDVILFESVFKYIAAAFNFISPPEIIYKKQMCKLIFSGKKLLKEIKAWLVDSKSNNWAIGINYVQWIINSTFDTFDKKQALQYKTFPYQAHFGVRPKFSSIVRDSGDFEEICIQNEITCAVCTTNTFKAIICDNCDRAVHSACSTKILIKNKDMNYIRVECKLCENFKCK